MINELKNAILGWYESLNERDKKAVFILVSLLLPTISIYIYFKQMDKREKLQQKISSLPSFVKGTTQLQDQITNIEKNIVYYKSQIPKLQAMLLNPNIKYAYTTAPNQISVVLPSLISQIGGYTISFEEGTPKDFKVDENGNLFTMPVNADKKNKSITSKRIFNIETIPVKLSVATSQDNVANFISSLNAPNPSYPFLFVNSIKFGFGKSQCSANIFDKDSSSVVSVIPNTKNLNTSKPILLCLTGYIISDIKESPVVSKPTKSEMKHEKKK